MNINQIKKAYKRLLEHYEIDYSNFLETFILVISRNFGRKKSEYFEDINTMVPFLDLLNHDNNYNTDFKYDDKKFRFILYAIKDIEIGEELTDFYGEVNNLDLFINYILKLKMNLIHFIK